MAFSTKGLNSFAFGSVVTMRSSRALIKETARLRSIDVRCSLVRPSLRCAFWCRMTLKDPSYPYSFRLCAAGCNCLLLVVDIGKVAEIGAVATPGSGDWISLFVKFHPKVQTHAVQDFLNFVQRLLAEILGSQHLAFAALYQITNRSDIRILETVVRAH